MDHHNSIDAYILGLTIDPMEPYLEERGFGKGLVLFALPALGIQFKCRVNGEGVNLELGALLTLLQFLKKKLANTKLTRLKVFASDPAFVFSIVHQIKDEGPKGKQYTLLKKYLKNLTLELAIIPLHRNLARLSPQDIPSIPTHVSPAISPDSEDNRPRFSPLQKGVSLK